MTEPEPPPSSTTLPAQPTQAPSAAPDIHGVPRDLLEKYPPRRGQFRGAGGRSNPPRRGGGSTQRGARGGNTSASAHPRQEKPRAPRPAKESQNGIPVGPEAEAGEGSSTSQSARKESNKPKQQSRGPAQRPSPGPSKSRSDATDPVAPDEGIPAPQNSRRRQFGSKLTESNAVSPSSKKPVTVTTPAAQEMDLTARLTASFSRSASAEDAPDCSICLNPIAPGAPTWSCTPQTSELDPAHAEHGSSSCCWSSFHLKCIKAWAAKSVKATGDAFVARGVLDRGGEWRCPGCQTRRNIVPAEYRCFCGSVVDPRPGRLSTPHSCGQGCGRKREKCDHPCPLYVISL